MKPFVAVIGTRNSGKSTVIKSLTGCPTKSWRDVVTDRSTGRRLYAIASSPQEVDLTPEEFEEIIDKVLRDDSLLGIVMAIQPSTPTVRMSLEDIFHMVEGKLAPFGVMLHPPYNDDSTSSPVSVQTRLAPFGVTLTVLNGQHFAYLSASEIRELAGIP